MNHAACERWSDLTDRAAIGEQLGAEQARFVREHVAACASCAAEARVWEALGGSLDARSEAPSALELPAARSVATPTSRSARSLMFGLAAAAAVALAATAAVVVSQRGGSAPATTNAVDGAVRLMLVAGRVEVRGAQAAAGAALGPTDAVEVGRGRACIAYGRGISACADDGSELRVLSPVDGHRRLVLEAGAVVCRLDAPPSGTRFSVETSQGRVTAKGTVFAVEQLGEGEIAVRVHRGVVEVESNRGETLELRAPAAAVVGTEIQPLPPPAEAWQRDARLAALAGLWAEGAVAPMEVGARPAGARVTVDGIDLGEAPLSTLIGRGEHELVIAQAGFEPLRERFVVRGAERVVREAELAPLASASPAAGPKAAESAAPPAGVSATVATATPSAAELLARARSHRGAGRFAEAARSYQELVAAHGGSAEARAALVSLGELQLSQLAQPAAALRSFDAYLAGGGALTQEARYGRIRALGALGRTGDASAATVAFLRDYPGSAQARSLRERTDRR